MSNFGDSHLGPLSINTTLLGNGVTSEVVNGPPTGTHLIMRIGGKSLCLEFDIEDSMAILNMLEDACKEFPLFFNRGMAPMAPTRCPTCGKLS
jgi:hypothetical protein